MSGSGYSLWKRRQDRKRKDAPWHISWTDETGRRRSCVAYPDRAASEAMGRRLVDEAARRAEGLVDSAIEGGKAPILQVVADFIDNLRAKGRSVEYVAGMDQRIRAVIVGSDAKRLLDLDSVRIERFLRDLKQPGPDEQGLSGYTLNEYRAAIKGLTKWAVENRRLPSDPLAALKLTERKALDPVHPRRALTADEIAALMDAAERRPVIDVQTIRRGKRTGELGANVAPAALERARRLGQQRRLCYLLAAWSGLRRGELRQLTWGDIYLDTIPARIQLRARTTKSKRADSLPLHPQLADELRQTKPAKAKPGDRVLQAVPNMVAFRADLKLAGIEPKDDRGLYVHFHSLRVSLSTLLAAAGVGQRTAQAIMRHSDPRLTAGTYTDERILPLAAALAAVPPIPPASSLDGQRASLRLTGTDDMPAGQVTVTAPAEGDGADISASVGVAEPDAQQARSTGAANCGVNRVAGGCSGVHESGGVHVTLAGGAIAEGPENGPKCTQMQSPAPSGTGLSRQRASGFEPPTTTLATWCSTN